MNRLALAMAATLVLGWGWNATAQPAAAAAPPGAIAGVFISDEMAQSLSAAEIAARLFPDNPDARHATAVRWGLTDWAGRTLLAVGFDLKPLATEVPGYCRLRSLPLLGFVRTSTGYQTYRTPITDQAAAGDPPEQIVFQRSTDGASCLDGGTRVMARSPQVIIEGETLLRKAIMAARRQGEVPFELACLSPTRAGSNVPCSDARPTLAELDTRRLSRVDISPCRPPSIDRCITLAADHTPRPGQQESWTVVLEVGTAIRRAVVSYGRLRV